MRPRAFTLIELLVVIGILAILAAILFPVFSRAKAQAKQTGCLSNLKQVGVSLGLYMTDHDDLFPYAVDTVDKYRPEIWGGSPQWQARIPYMPLLHEALQPYAKSKQIFQCPADTGSRVLDNHWYIPFETSPSGYATYGSSYFFRTEIAFRQYTQTSFQLPANVNVYFDMSGHWHAGERAMSGEGQPLDLWRLRERYRYNTLFGDFHAKSLNTDQFDRAWATPL